MPKYVFEALDAQGSEIRDEIEAQSQDEAQSTIRGMGYFVTRISVKKEAAGLGGPKKTEGKSFVIGGVRLKDLTVFTRQLSILQDAGLPILRSLRILKDQQKPSALKNALIDVCAEIEGGATLSESLAKAPKVFDRLYVNMIRAGEAGGALEVILRRLAEFMETSLSLKRKVQGAMIYPAVVVNVAIGILTFIMIAIVPTFEELFRDFELDLPPPTRILITISHWAVRYWFLVPLIPMALAVFVKLVRKFKAGRMGWDLYLMKMFIIGNLVEKAVLARTTRTLGTLVSSGVPILEGLTITRETSNNAMFERMFAKIADAVRDGDTLARPMKVHARPSFHPVTLFFWMNTLAFPLSAIIFMPDLLLIGLAITAAGGLIGGLLYLIRMNKPVVEALVVNMVEVGEETGELDTMLYKVADYYDEEVKNLTEGLLKIIEPLLMVFLGGAVGFIVISLFMPLVELITKLSK